MNACLLALLACAGEENEQEHKRETVRKQMNSFFGLFALKLIELENFDATAANDEVSF